MLHTIDTKGLKCPGPTLKLTSMIFSMKTGDAVEVVADCPTFEKDVRDWCMRNKKTLLWVKQEPGNVKRCQIQF